MNEYEKALYIYSHLESEQTVGEYTPLEYEKARLKLKELVDRAIPTKPEYEADRYYNGKLIYDTWVCPNCNNTITCSIDRKQIQKICKFKICPVCGQALLLGESDGY